MQDINVWTGETVTLEEERISQEQLAEIERQIIAYAPPEGREEWFTRHGGVYAKYSEKRLSRSSVSRIFHRFLRHERRDYLRRHDMKLDDILRVGIEQFIVANGWRKPDHVASWRSNVVRIGICPGCGKHFVPQIVQVNQGLCLHCRKEFSFKAIRQFVLEQIDRIDPSGEERKTEEPSTLVNFHILFKNDQRFRDLFRNEDPFAQELEARADAAKENVSEPPANCE